MKKRFFHTILVIISFCLVLQGCSPKSEYSAPDLATKVFDPEKSPDCFFYYGFGYSTDTFDRTLMQRIYGVYECISKCSDYSLYLSKDDSVFEMHFFRVRSLYDTDSIVKMLERRIDLVTRPEYSDYSGKKAEYRICVRKDIVSLFITGDNDYFEKRLEKYV